MQATLDFGFESVKYDGCGIERNITHFAALYNDTGVPVLIESCGNGGVGGNNPSRAVREPSGKVSCPMNLFRLSDDLHPVWHSILLNLNSTMEFNSKGLTGPGCWGYPDMCVVVPPPPPPPPPPPKAAPTLLACSLTLTSFCPVQVTSRRHDSFRWPGHSCGAE